MIYGEAWNVPCTVGDLECLAGFNLVGRRGEEGGKTPQIKKYIYIFLKKTRFQMRRKQSWRT